MNTNENSLLSEEWHAQINNIVHKTTFDELKTWIKSGKLQPNHKVRIRNLSWIEAKKIPAFQKLFEPGSINISAQPNSPQNLSHSGIPASPPVNPKPKEFSGFPKQIPALLANPIDNKPFVLVEINNSKAPNRIIEPKKTSPIQNPPLVAAPIVSPIQNKKDEMPEIPALLKEIPKNLVGNAAVETNTSVPLKTEITPPVEIKENFAVESETIAESSLPFQLYKKKQAEKKHNKKTEKTKKVPIFNTKSLKPKANRRISIQPILTFLAGSCFMIMLAWGGAYLSVFQLGLFGNIDENKISELVILNEKLTTDKVGVRLRVAASEREAAAIPDDQEKPPKLDLAQELGKLQKQYDLQRKVIIESHQTNYLNDSFNNSFYGGSVVFLVLFVFIKGSYSKPNKISLSKTVAPFQEKPTEITSLDESVDTQISADQKIGENDYPNIHATKISEIHSTNSSEMHITNQSNIHLSNMPNGEGAVVFQTSNSKHFSDSQKTHFCLLHQDKTSKFLCEKCSNHFCGECVEVVNSVENNCPFCKIVCKSIDQAGFLQNETNSSLDVSEQPDQKIQKVGIFTAFIISLFLAVPMSYFWVYEISPRLENGEIVSVAKVFNEQGSANINSNPNQSENVPLENQNIITEKRKEDDKRSFTQISIVLFVLLFGWLILTRFIGQKKKDPVSLE